MNDRRTFLGSIAASSLLYGSKSRTMLAGPAKQQGQLWNNRLSSLLGIVLYPDIKSGLADVQESAFFAVAGDGDVFATTYQNQKGQAVEQARYASEAAFKGTGGAALIGYRQRTVAGKLDDQLSVFDFMTAEEIQSVIMRAETHEVTEAMNQCFSAAQAAGRTVYIPDGTYLVGNLLFGMQNRTAQSQAPLGLVGQSRGGAYLKARRGLTGTLLQSWSVAGVRFSDFTIDASGTAAMAWDCDWKAYVGPSTQCLIHGIRIIGGTSPTIVSLRDMNDTYPDNLLVVGNSPSQCGIDMVQTGGLSAIRNSHWPFCFLRFAAQAGIVDNCVGMGIELASGGLNYVTILSGQIYANTVKKSLIWSERFDTGPSAKSFRAIGTTLIGDNGGDVVAKSYLNVNAFSTIDLEGCQFIGSSIPLLGPDSRSDSQTTVRVRIRGGGRTPQRALDQKLILNDKPGIVIIAEDFMDDATGRMVAKDWDGTFEPTIVGTLTAGTASYGDRLVRGVGLEMR